MQKETIFFDLITNSQKIVITTHINPDPDGICSTLFVYSFLKRIYPEKQCIISVEDSAPVYLSHLDGFRLVQENVLPDLLKNEKPDLLIMLDGNNYSRFTRTPSDEINNLIKNLEIKTVILDHHPVVDTPTIDCYIDFHHVSNCEGLFRVFNNLFTIDFTNEEKEILLTGILSDTGFLTYPNDHLSDTLNVISQCVNEKASISKVKAKIDRISAKQHKIIFEFQKNLIIEDGYAYTFLSIDFVKSMVVDEFTQSEYLKASHFFIDNILNVIRDCKFSFLVLPDYKNDYKTDNPKCFNVSLRTTTDHVDVSKLARVFDGGGHRVASGLSIQAKSHEMVIGSILEAYNRTEFKLLNSK